MRWSRNSAVPGRGRVVTASAIASAVMTLASVITATSAAAAGTQTTFTAVADSWVDSKHKSSNYGTSWELQVSKDTRSAYLRFNVEGLAGTVTAVSLRLYANNDYGSGYNVRSVSNTTWGETTITYNNAPPMSSTVIGSSGSVKKGWTSVDVTPLVTGNGLVSIGVLTTTGGTFRVATRETGGNAPQLVVTTAPPTDTMAPSTPGGLTAVAANSGEVDLAWGASTDDVGVAGYTVYRNGAAVGTATGTSYADGGLAAGGTYSYTVDAYDAAGNHSAQSTVASATTPAATGDPIIGAAGDIACDPANASFNSGDGTVSACAEKATAALLASSPLAAVLTLGDDQYEDGAFSKWSQSYGPTWGAFKSITYPGVGNHEYGSGSGSAAGYFSYFGAAAGDPSKGYYSVDVGAWHIVALNGECIFVGGCGTGSPQEVWLRADLAAHPTTCTLAFWHEARFTSGWSGNHTAFDAFWKDLYAAGADVVLNGHDHIYERFAPQTPGAVADATYGIREFIVGTGGRSHSSIASVQPNSDIRNITAFGVLELTLHPAGYDWSFIPVAGSTFTDSGSQACHATPPANVAANYATRDAWPATDGLSVRRVSDRPDD